MAGTATAGAIRFIWIKPPSDLARDLTRRKDQLPPTLLAGMTQIAEKMVSYAQANAPWNDRTGDARRLLAFFPGQSGNSVTIVGQHRVPYGGFLETGTSRMQAYPIIRPTLEAHYSVVRQLMDQIAGSG